MKRTLFGARQRTEINENSHCKCWSGVAKFIRIWDIGIDIGKAVRQVKITNKFEKFLSWIAVSGN